MYKQEIEVDSSIEIIKDIPVEIVGDSSVKKLILKNSEIETDGVFIAVGIIPNTDKFRNLVKLDEARYIIAGEEGITETPGVFAAGDIRTKMLRQVVTAVADGANAVISAHNYLIRH